MNLRPKLLRRASFYIKPDQCSEFIKKSCRFIEKVEQVTKEKK